MSPNKRPKSGIVQALAVSDDEDDYDEEELEERAEAARATRLLYGNYETEAAKRLSTDMRTVFEGQTSWSSESPGEFKLTQTRKTQQPDGSWRIKTMQTTVPRSEHPPPPGSQRVPFNGDAKFGEPATLPYSAFGMDSLGRVKTSPKRRRFGEKSPDYIWRQARRRKPVHRVEKFTADQYSRIDSRFVRTSPTSPPRGAPRSQVRKRIVSKRA